MMYTVIPFYKDLSRNARRVFDMIGWDRVGSDIDGRRRNVHRFDMREFMNLVEEGVERGHIEPDWADEAIEEVQRELSLSKSRVRFERAVIADDRRWILLRRMTKRAMQFLQEEGYDIIDLLKRNAYGYTGSYNAFSVVMRQLGSDLDSLAIAVNKAEPTQRNVQTGKIKKWPTRKTWRKKLEGRRDEVVQLTDDYKDELDTMGLYDDMNEFIDDLDFALSQIYNELG